METWCVPGRWARGQLLLQALRFLPSHPKVREDLSGSAGEPAAPRLMRQLLPALPWAPCRRSVPPSSRVRGAQPPGSVAISSERSKPSYFLPHVLGVCADSSAVVSIERGEEHRAWYGTRMPFHFTMPVSCWSLGSVPCPQHSVRLRTVHRK